MSYLEFHKRTSEEGEFWTVKRYGVEREVKQESELHQILEQARTKL